MKHMLNDLIIQYGYFGLFLGLVGGIVGLPVPDEVLLTFVGYNITVGRMGLTPSIAVAFAGSIIGITVSFLLGKLLGLPFLHKYGNYLGINEKRIQYVHVLFEKWGGLLLFIGYFIPGVRSVTAFIAAVSEMKYLKFASFAYLGAMVWVLTFLILGEGLGKEWHRVLGIIHSYKTVSYFVIGVILVFIIWRMINNVNTKRK